jgi:hypothetical protein
MLDSVFKDKKRITFEDFHNIIKNETSEMFLAVSSAKDILDLGSPVKLIAMHRKLLQVQRKLFLNAQR